MGVKYRGPRLGQKVLPDGEPQRRENRFGNYTLPGHHGAIRSSGTRSRRTLSSTPGSRAIGGNAYRRSLGHVCVIASSPRGAGCVRENQSGQWDVNRSTCAWPNFLHISSTTSGVEPLFPGPQPLSQQDVCSYIVDPRDVSCSQRQPQEDLARQFAKWMWPPWWFM